MAMDADGFLKGGPEMSVKNSREADLEDIYQMLRLIALQNREARITSTARSVGSYKAIRALSAVETAEERILNER